MAPHPEALPEAPDLTAGPSWPGVEHRHLASLAAVAQACSFRGASRRLGYSQSALSQHVAQLERLVGAELVERHRGRADVALTDAGRTLLRHVDRILAMYRAAEVDLAALAAPGSGSLRVAVAEHLATTVPAAVLPAFLRAHPGVDVTLSGGADPEALAAAARAGSVDLVVGDPPADLGGLTVTAVAPEPCVLAVPATWAVARRALATGAVGDLLEHLPVALDAGDPDGARIGRELRAHGITLAPDEEHGGASLLLAWVAAGRSAAILPRALAGDDPRVLVLPLDGFVAPRAVAAYWLRDRRRSALMTTFAGLLREDRARSAGPSRPLGVNTPGTDHIDLEGSERGRLVGS
jgi:molybdate transport repressor ModE-like protein